MPVQYTGGDGKPGKAVFGNTGDTPTTINGAPSANGGIKVVGGDCTAGKVLQPGEMCTVEFELEDPKTTASGTGEIKIGTDKGDVTQAVNWSGDTVHTGFVSEQPSGAPDILFKGELYTKEITITNNSKVDITGITIQKPDVSGMDIVIDNGNCDTLKAGASCTFTAKITAKEVTADQNSIKFTYSGKYADNGAAVGSEYIMNYKAEENTSNTPNLIFDAKEITLNVAGDNKDSKTAKITVTNAGKAAATITSMGLTGNPAYLTDAGGSCKETKQLAAGASCEEEFKLGPALAEISTLQGDASYVVKAEGAEPGKATIHYQVEAANRKVDVTSKVAGNNGGDGSEATPYVFEENSTGSITFTYKNSGTIAQKVTSVSLGDQGSAYWVKDTSSCDNATLAAGQECTVVLKLASNISEAAKPVVTAPELTLEAGGSNITAGGDTQIHTQINHSPDVGTITPTIKVENEGTPGARIVVDATYVGIGTANFSFSVPTGLIKDQEELKASGCTFVDDGANTKISCSVEGGSSKEISFAVNGALAKDENRSYSITFTSGTEGVTFGELTTMPMTLDVKGSKYKGYYIHGEQMTRGNDNPYATVEVCPITWQAAIDYKKCNQFHAQGIRSSSLTTTVINKNDVYFLYNSILTNHVSHCKINPADGSFYNCTFTLNGQVYAPGKPFGDNTPPSKGSSYFSRGPAIILGDKLHWVGDNDLEGDPNVWGIKTCSLDPKADGNVESGSCTESLHGIESQDFGDHDTIDGRVGQTIGLYYDQSHNKVFFFNSRPKLVGTGPVTNYYVCDIAANNDIGNCVKKERPDEIKDSPILMLNNGYVYGKKGSCKITNETGDLECKNYAATDIYYNEYLRWRVAYDHAGNLFYRWENDAELNTIKFNNGELFNNTAGTAVSYDGQGGYNTFPAYYGN